MTKHAQKMQRLNRNSIFMRICLMMVGIFMLAGCDSGENTMDHAIGNEAVKQYHKLKRDIGKIGDQQAERFNNVLEENKKDGGEKP
ncbi:MAG: hypothetical protein K9N21_08325 [Deltaproteobacteria bacterium]|nr:hypothetical protein [Deltaproteobacteria bacterium]